MSATAMTWAWRQATRSSGQRLVLLALADHAADHDDQPGFTGWPSVGRLTMMTGLGQSTIRLHIDTLVEDDLVIKVERRRRANGYMSTWIYQLAVDNPASTAGPPAVGHPSTAGPPAVGHRRSTGAHELQLQKGLEKGHGQPQRRAGPPETAEAIADAYGVDLNPQDGDPPEWFDKYGPTRPDPDEPF